MNYLIKHLEFMLINYLMEIQEFQYFAFA